MITTDDCFDALQKATAYAPDRVPAPSEAVVMAWSEHFEQFPHLTRDDLLQAVTVFYREPHADHLLQPAHISKTARALHQDRAMREPLTELEPPPIDDDADEQPTEVAGESKRWNSRDDEHPPGAKCERDGCPKPSTFAQFCARHYVLAHVGLVGREL